MKNVGKVLQILLAALREIFDEAAYARFLERSKIVSSPAAYAEFCCERDCAHSPRPRCC